MHKIAPVTFLGKKFWQNVPNVSDFRYSTKAFAKMLSKTIKSIWVIQ